MTVAAVRLLVIIGKGGVGRSTVAAAVARREAESGRSVLVVDALADGGTAGALGLSSPPPLGQITDLGPAFARISLLELGTEASLDEYLALNLRIPIAPRTLRPIAKMFDYVAIAAPAVREILTIGKIGHEVRRGRWDLVVVDGPATGHVVELLSAPAVLGELVGFGPLGSETAWLSDLLADDEVTAALVVTLAEELPVTETLELTDRVRKETDVRLAGVVVNRTPVAISSEGEAEAARIEGGGGPLAELAAIAVDRARAAARQRERLAELDLPLVEVAEDLDDPTSSVIAALDAAGW